MLLTSQNFEGQRPNEWQRIFVWDGESWQDGYYHFSDHHTYPHEICQTAGDYSSRIECFAPDAEWMPYRY